MNLSDIFTLSYHFDFTPNASTPSILLALYFVALTTLRIYLKNKINKHTEKKILKKLINNHINIIGIISILGVLTVTSRQIGVPFFGMRIFGEVFLICSIIRLILIYRGFTVKLTNKLQTNTYKKEIDKYIPKAKKHKKKKR